MRKILPLFLAVLLLCPVARGAETEKYVALTFDDGPSGRFTRRLLAGLEERDARATFFLCGYRLEQYPELAEEMLAAGHEIGLHGYSHDDMTRMSRREIARELADTRALLPEDCKIRFLRPPGGSCNSALRQVSEATGLAIALWSVDPRDWATRDTSAVRRRLIDQIGDGDVVLLHDMSNSSVDAALAVIDQLQARGFRFVTLSELAQIRRTRLRAGRLYTDFYPKSMK